ncbi:hypothetical protein, partial [Anaerosolibacter sp.]|uniref:hypothetical protein n=1 Tax=Anaerosolibacter sp. TaxID=1872527 RepID=UPI0039F01A00
IFLYKVFREFRYVLDEFYKEMPFKFLSLLIRILIIQLIQSTTSIILLNTYTENGLSKNLVRHLNDEIDIYMVYSLIRLPDIFHAKRN